jgi:PTH1 family peptidyl-tRNA hydrolase
VFLVVGLGNPGPEYEDTRHNLGFKVIDELARKHGLTALKSKFHSFIGEVKVQQHKIILAQPQTFMNSSGLAVRGMMDWYKLLPSHLILIYDDVDLELGQLRVRDRGNAGGHHGVESVIESMGTTEFIRIRLGIGRESMSGDVSGYVLQQIPSSQRESLDQAVITAAEAIEAVMADGLVAAMNKFNG